MLIILCDLVFFVVEVLGNVWYEKRLKRVEGGPTLTASKLINESTATVAALLSALFASRRNRVLERKQR